MKVKNYMEYAVEDVLNNLLNREVKAEFTEKDLADIKAITLNSLPPQYTVSEKGNVFVKVKEQLIVQFKADVIRELLKAMDIVSKNPRA